MRAGPPSGGSYLVSVPPLFEEVGRGYGRSMNIEQYNMARFAAFVRSTTGLVRRNLCFGVTPKLGADVALSRRWVLPQALIFMLNVDRRRILTTGERHAGIIAPQRFARGWRTRAWH
jgi:hypothetical protein